MNNEDLNSKNINAGLVEEKTQAQNNNENSNLEQNESTNENKPDLDKNLISSMKGEM